MALAEHFRTYRHRPYWNAHPATREKRATEENYPWLDDGPFDGPEKQKPRKSLNLRGFVFATGGEGPFRTPPVLRATGQDAIRTVCFLALSRFRKTFFTFS